MIEKKRRITTKEFPIHSKNRHVWTGKIIKIVYIEDNTLKCCKFSATAGKKTVKFAVRRNFFKRCVYEAIRTHLTQFEGFYQGLFVVSPLPQAKHSFHLVEADIKIFLSAKKYG